MKRTTYAFLAALALATPALAASPAVTKPAHEHALKGKKAVQKTVEKKTEKTESKTSATDTSKAAY